MLADVRFLVCLLWCLSSETSSASHLLNFCFNSTFNLFLLLLQETGLFLFRPQVQIIFIDKEKVNYLVLDVFLLLYDGQGVSQYFPSWSFSVVMADLYRSFGESDFGLLLYSNFCMAAVLKTKQKKKKTILLGKIKLIQMLMDLR